MELPPQLIVMDQTNDKGTNVLHTAGSNTYRFTFGNIQPADTVSRTWSPAARRTPYVSQEANRAKDEFLANLSPELRRDGHPLFRLRSDAEPRGRTFGVVTLLGTSLLLLD